MSECNFKEQKITVSCYAPKSLHKLTIWFNNNFFTVMVYSESNLKVEKSSKTTDTMNGTILGDATNKNPASICTLENSTSRCRLLFHLS